MASIVGLAGWAAALGSRTAWEVDRIGQVVDAGILGPVEDTNPAEESHMALERNHEVGNLVGRRDQNADSVGEGSIGESTVAVETSGDLADEVLVAEAAAAVAVDSADSADFAGEVEREAAAAPVGSELAASTKECRSGGRSACQLWSELWEGSISFKSKGWIFCISEGRQRKFPHGFALSVVQVYDSIRKTSSPNADTWQICRQSKPHSTYLAHSAVRRMHLLQV